MQPWQKGAVVLTTVEEGRTFSGREGHGLRQTEAFTAEAQAQGHGEIERPTAQPGAERRDSPSGEVTWTENQPACRYVALTSQGSSAKKESCIGQ